jgi:hypothetical protein
MRPQDTAGMNTPEQFRQYVVELLTTGDEAISESVAQECASQIIETLEANPEVSRALARQ